MKNIYTISLVLLTFFVQAQDYYYNGSEKIELEPSQNHL